MSDSIASMKTGELIDEIHDCVCAMDLTSGISLDEYTDLFRLVDELKARSQKMAGKIPSTDQESH